jgi:hypothetical protein
MPAFINHQNLRCFAQMCLQNGFIQDCRAQRALYFSSCGGLRHTSACFVR